MNDQVPSLDLYTTILRVRDLERSVEWYRSVLGLKPVNRDFQYRLVEMVSARGQRITLRELSDDKPIITSGLRSAYVVFITPNVDEAHSDLLAKGEAVGAVQDHPGVRLFWIEDPDGHPLCILQFVIDWVA